MDAQKSDDFKTYRRVVLYALVTLLTARWFFVTTHCITEFNGGRVLQCSVEPLWKEVPDSDNPKPVCGDATGAALSLEELRACPCVAGHEPVLFFTPGTREPFFRCVPGALPKEKP